MRTSQNLVLFERKRNQGAKEKCEEKKKEVIKDEAIKGEVNRTVNDQ